MPYQLNPAREISLLLAGISLVALAVYIDRKDTLPIQAATLRNPHAGARNPLDELAYRKPDANAAELADAGLYGGPTLPLLLSLHPRSRPSYPALLLIWLETMLLNFAITSVIKNRVSRPRPYVLNPEFDRQQPLSRNDRAAFLSGHASNAATGAVLFSQYVACFTKRPAVSIAAHFIGGLVPGFTGYLRVKAAKHWPTDALAGVLLGGVIGWFVPWLHRGE